MSPLRLWLAGAARVIFSSSAKAAAGRAGAGYRGPVDATFADIPDIACLELPVFRAHEQRYNDDFPDPMDDGRLSAFYAEFLRNGAGGAAIYVADGAAVGDVAWTFHRHFGANQAHIHSIVVAPDYRSRGIGRELLSHAIRRAAERQAECLRAIVWNHNDRSRAFFRAAGFGQVSETYGISLSADGKR